MKILIGIMLITMSTLSTMSFAHQYHAYSAADKVQDNLRMKKIIKLMTQARRASDEKYYIKASKLLTKVDKPTQQATIFKAEIQQYFHQFDAALETLSKVKGHSGADLLRASIYFTQGKFKQAHTQCKELFGRTDNLLALICTSHANSLQGELERATNVLEASMRHVPSNSKSITSWAYVTLAEMSERMAKYEKAKLYYAKALEINRKDMPTRIAYADILLYEKNYPEVIRLTEKYKNNDLLALRYVRALKLSGQHENSKVYSELSQRIENYTEKTRHLHFDLLAEYNLYFKHDTQAALQWAKRHWQQQKTPRDARLLAFVSAQAGDTDAAKLVSDWMKKYSLEDKRLMTLLENKSI